MSELRETKTKEKHPSWFKMKIERRELVRQLSPETAVNVLLACWDYLETGERPLDLSPIENIAFASFIPDMEEAWKMYTQRIRARNGKGKSDDIDRNRLISDETEEETEPEPEEEGEKEVCKAPKAPTRARPVRKKYGQYGWVNLSDEEYNHLLNDLGQAEFERCIAYIDEAAQSTGNKNKWRDWNLVIRRCHRDRWGLGTGAGKPNVRPVPSDEDYLREWGDT